MTPLSCNYTIAPLKDSVPVLCDRVAIRRVTFEVEAEGQEPFVMLYCFQHWSMVRDLGEVLRGQKEDLVEEQC